jgi:LysM repeat protein
MRSVKRPWVGIAAALFFGAVIAAPAVVAAERGGGAYVIRKGDTPGEVAKRFGISVEELLRFNNLGEGGPFRVGDSIEIPKSGEVTGAKYAVQPGDSVAKVADFHGVSQDDLREANSLGPDEALQPGSELVIPMSLRGGAARGHVVEKGDTIASIAKEHGVTPKALARANKLGKGARLKLGRTLVVPEPGDPDEGGGAPAGERSKLVVSGEKIPGGVRHTVQPGQTLWIIARAYNVPGGAIAKRNGIETNTPLKPGAELVVPGAKEPVPVRVKGYAAQPIHFVRVWNNESLTIRLVNKAGKVGPDARRKLSALAGPRHKGKKARRTKPLDARLLHMVQRVAERWPGQTLEIISGYRPRLKGHESRHSMAKALDFRVKGVPNRELFEFCKELPDSGCGFYPNSVFVHMDSREKTATWIDYSAPGEKPRYRKPEVEKPEAGAAAVAEVPNEEAEADLESPDDQSPAPAEAKP